MRAFETNLDAKTNFNLYNKLLWLFQDSFIICLESQRIHVYDTLRPFS